MEEQKEISKDSEPASQKGWRCGDKYQYPLPEAKDDPWTQLLDPLRKKDAERCQMWKDEVQNILIFAGLFSAVVTAFIIESYKSLRKDPVEVMLEYLVANRTGNQTSFPVTTDSFSLPDSSSTRINTLWFLSLVFSLVTVLIGTIALQWLREHQHNHGDLEPQVAFSLHQMQVESLNRWLVPHIFTLLSLLLLGAVVLFLLGLVELLWLMNRTVGAWVGAAVALALSFVVLTTVLPTVQAAFLFLPLRVAHPRSPCPYRSPQAWAFHRLCSPIVQKIAQAFGERCDRYSKIDSHNITSEQGRLQWLEPLPHGTGILFRGKQGDSWLEHGVAWLYQRDFDYMSAYSREDAAVCVTKRLPIPLYDAVQGLLDIKQTASVTHATCTAVDHGIGLVLTANEQKPYGRFLHRMSLAEPMAYGVPPGVVPPADDYDVLQEDATLRLLSRNTSFDGLPADAEQRGLEICIRLTDWLYGQRDSRMHEHPQDSDIYLPPQSLPVQWIVYILENRPIDPECAQQIRSQIRQILLKFFERVKTYDCDTTPVDTTMDNNAYMGRFLAAAAKILAIGQDNDTPICDEILSSLQREDGTSSSTLHGYRAALVFCHAMFAKVKTMTPSLGRLVGALRKYDEVSEGLDYLPFPFPNLSWARFLRDLGIDDPEISSRYSNYRTPPSSFIIVEVPSTPDSEYSLRKPPVL